MDLQFCKWKQRLASPNTGILILTRLPSFLPDDQENTETRHQRSPGAGMGVGDDMRDFNEIRVESC